MKKVIPVLFVLFLLLTLTTKNNDYIIPNDAIRFRVIANSNTFEDQATKIEIKNNIENLLKDDLLNTTNKEETENIIKNSLTNIKQMLNNYNIPYKINYGNNYFPTKKYKGTVYEEGYYESLVVTLGDGNGDNWWCLMYPPLCLIDEENLTNAEYKLYVQELFEKFNSNKL